MSEPVLVRTRTEGGVAVLELTNPPANGYSHEMMKQLDAAIIAARFDRDVQVIVLRGAGDRFFCAGADIRMLQDADPAWKYYFCLHANETLNRLEHTPKLTIAALNGHTVGGGLEVALACDLRLGRAGGGKVGLPEVALGVLPGTGGTQRLGRVLGKSKAIQLMIEGRNLSMEEALALGIVNDVIGGEEPEWFVKVLEYARRFVPPNKASRAVGHIKRAVQSGVELSLEGGLALERELQQRLFESDDAAEGLAAYVEKRPPRFTGR
jgi:enoyl-CoA hydratase/carnithine racemase